MLLGAHITTAYRSIHRFYFYFRVTVPLVSVTVLVLSALEPCEHPAMWPTLVSDNRTRQCRQLDTQGCGSGIVRHTARHFAMDSQRWMLPER